MLNASLKVHLLEICLCRLEFRTLRQGVFLRLVSRIQMGSSWMFFMKDVVAELEKSEKAREMLEWELVVERESIFDVHCLNLWRKN